MKVCEIRRDGDIIRVDDASFSTADDAYKLFRNLYNKALGKANYSKLGHSGVRTSRITATGIVFTALVLLTVAVIVILFSIFASRGRFIKPLTLNEKLDSKEGFSSSRSFATASGFSGRGAS